MRAGFWAVLFVSMALMVSVSTGVAHAQPALQDEPYLVKATTVSKYLRYYAPYAIQAAAAYLPVSELDGRRLTQDGNGYGADVNYAVNNAVTSDVRAAAQDIIKGWQYQFGSESELTCIDPNDVNCQNALRNKGWNFGSGPAFQVWARTRFPHAGRQACSEVSIAFRGTVGLSGGDWFSNADRFGSPYDDYYHQLGRNIDGIIGLIKNLDCYKLAGRKPQIVSTGHSLGGGLAQFVALANNPAGPQITKVFAFDPSPVTGTHIIDKRRLAANADGLTIDRIYQEGEVLSIPRRLIQEYPQAKLGCKPFVRTVKFDAVPGSGPLGLHGIQPLASKIVQLSYEGDTPQPYQAPGVPPGCTMRYEIPGADGELVASAGGRQVLYAFVRNHKRYVAVAAMDAIGGRQDELATKSAVKLIRIVKTVSGSRSRKLRLVNS
jgi:hypothetical protein